MLDWKFKLTILIKKWNLFDLSSYWDKFIIIFVLFQGNRLFKEGKYELAKAKYDHVCFSFSWPQFMYYFSVSLF